MDFYEVSDTGPFPEMALRNARSLVENWANKTKVMSCLAGTVYVVRRTPEPRKHNGMDIWTATASVPIVAPAVAMLEAGNHE